MNKIIIANPDASSPSLGFLLDTPLSLCNKQLTLLSL